MKEEKKPISINKQLRENYKKHFAQKTGYVSIFALVVFLCLALAYFIPLTLILTIPFIILPTLTGFIVENFNTNMNNGKSAGRIFYGFRTYFSPVFLGSYRIIECFIKSIIVYLISSSILTLVLHFTMGVNDPAYLEIFNNMALSQNNDELLKYFGDLQENSTFINIENIVVLTSFGLASYMFIHHVLTHSFKMYYNLLNKRPRPMFVVNLIHRRVFRDFRKDFYGDYYSSFFIIIILFVAGYVGGCFLGLFVLHQDGMQTVIISLALAFFVSMFFLPYIYDTYQLMFSIDNYFYMKGLVLLASDPITSSMYDLQLTTQEKEQIDTMIEAIGAFIKQAEEEKAKKKDEKDK